MKILMLGLVLGSCSVAWAQSSDFPGGVDLRSVARPAGSLMVGAMHIDDDEYQVPVGPVERQAKTAAKAVTVRGPVDAVAYSGPTTASTLTTYSGMAAQLTAAGYKEVWGCVRKTCGDAYTLVNIMTQPLVDTMHEGSWGGWIIEALYTSNEDVRFGTFKKDGEYVMVMGALMPGHRSGALVVRANGPAGEPVLVARPATAEVVPAAEEPAAAPATVKTDAMKSAAKSVWGRIPH